MFESIESMNAKKEEKCEECGYKDILIDAVIDGEIKRICHKCRIANPVILLKKPSDIKIEDVPRRSVHEILENMSGVKPTPIEKPTSKITLEDLRKRYEEIKEKRRLKMEKEKEEIKKEEREEKEKILDEKEFIETLEKERNMEKKFPENSKEPEEIDFSIQATKHTRIRDLLKRMKRQEIKQPIPKPEPEPPPQPKPESLPNQETDPTKSIEKENKEEKKEEEKI